MFRKRKFSGFRGKRRFRRNKGVWFPITGATWTNEGETFNDVSFTLTPGPVGVDRSLRPGLEVIPLTRDYTPINANDTSDINQKPTLRDFTEGQDYILSSIVGNVDWFVDANTNQLAVFDPAEQWTYVKITSGFFVGRTGDLDETLPDFTADEIDPQVSTNSQNPWIWRKSWILANPANRTQVGIDPDNVPVYTEDDISSNRSLSDLRGPSIITKSKRRVRREERLWFVTSVIGWDGPRGSVSGGAPLQPTVKGNLDIRIFGKMVKGKNASTF